MASAGSPALSMTTIAEALAAMGKKPDVATYVAGEYVPTNIVKNTAQTSERSKTVISPGSAGRWGMRLFEGDQDLDVVCEVDDYYFTKGDRDADLSLSRMVHQTDMVAPPERRAYYKTAAYKSELDGILRRCRARLDAGFGSRLFVKLRGLEEEDGKHGQYRVIILGALCMRAGARIRRCDREHLRELVGQIPSRPGFSLPPNDGGFRDPGRAQFLAALDHCKAGTPRSFVDPSCFECGKMQVDIGKALDRCAACCNAWYCDRDCQKGHWSDHKAACLRSKTGLSLNV